MTTSSSKPSKSITALVIQGLITSTLTFVKSTCPSTLPRQKSEREKYLLVKVVGEFGCPEQLFLGVGSPVELEL